MMNAIAHSLQIQHSQQVPIAGPQFPIRSSILERGLHRQKRHSGTAASAKPIRTSHPNAAGRLSEIWTGPRLQDLPMKNLPMKNLNSSSPPRRLATAHLFQTAQMVESKASAVVTLRGLGATRQLRIGTELGGWDDRRWRRLAAQQFNYGTLETYWSADSTQRGVYNFQRQDRQVNWARRAQIQLYGHALVYPQFRLIPDWLRRGRFTREQYIEILQQHITTVMTHFKGKIHEWVVVNEALETGEHPRDFFQRKIGPDYVEIAFATARAVDPTATLIYNDYNNETTSGANTENTQQIVKRLKALGLIDAVGLQMHLGGSTRYRKADLVQTMRAYELPVHITELDVDLRSVAGSQTQRFRKQARLYRRVLEAALEAGVTTINVWGLSDRYSWLELPSERNASPLSDPCLYDENLQPKPAYQAWIEVLQGVSALPKRTLRP